MSYRAVTSGLVVLYKIRVDPNSAKRQKRLELKRAADWENATGVITGKQAAFEKAVRRYRYQISAKQILRTPCSHLPSMLDGVSVYLSCLY